MSEPPPAKRARASAAAVSEEEPHLTDAEARVVRIQFEKDNQFSGDYFDQLLKEYGRFLRIKLSNTSEPFAPSYFIDKLWHAHILSTREYLAFCQRHNDGAYLHHDPTMTGGQPRYRATLRIYKELFGEKPSDQRIWPDHVDQKPAIERGETNQQQQEEEDGGDDGDDDLDAEGEEEDDDSEDDDDDSEDDEEVQEYLEDFGDERGRTAVELAEWHREAILDPQNNEGFDPRKHPEISNCCNGHRWYDGEFTLSCEACRENSSNLGGFTCG